jgi:hypothetical protein
MPQGRAVYIAVIVALALAAGLFISNEDSQAITFHPMSTLWVSDDSLGANADIVINYDLNAPDSNFANAVLTFNSPEFVTSSVTLGKTTGYLMAHTVRLSLVNEGCLNQVPVGFRLVEASIDNSPGNSVMPYGLPQDRLLSWVQDDGDINNDGSVDNPARAHNGIADGAEWYPSFLNDLFSNVQPAHRYFGWQLVGGTPVHVTLNIVFFDPGDLLNVPSIPSSELLTAVRGSPSAVILNDPTMALSQGIDEFCTPLGTTTTLCGMTDDDPDNVPIEQPDCDVGASSEVVRTNPSVAGTYYLSTLTQPFRDVDGDGIENLLDPCPYNFDTWDPRATNAAMKAAGKDNDGDGLPNTCDPTNNPLSFDEDGDGLMNRIDTCPLVSNVWEPPSPNQGQADMDIVNWSTAVPDGGPRADNIGPECDTHPTTPDGQYHIGYTIGRRCLQGTDADLDGVCDDYPGEDDTDTDTDGDGVIDTIDNCIGRANPDPVGLTQMTPDILGNGVVQIDDVSYVAGKFGRTTGQNGYRAAAELASQNGTIQIDDVTFAAGSFGRNC